LNNVNELLNTVGVQNMQENNIFKLWHICLLRKMPPGSGIILN